MASSIHCRVCRLNCSVFPLTKEHLVEVFLGDQKMFDEIIGLRKTFVYCQIMGICMLINIFQ